MVTTIALIDDDQNLIKYLQELFKTSLEMNVKAFSSGIEGLNFLKTEEPKLLLLDLTLNDLQGISVYEEARKIYPTLPIIILTGDDSPDMLVKLLNMGANDYITKPFNNDELLARVKNKLKSTQDKSPSKILKTKDLVVDTERMKVTIDGKEVQLTGKEILLLEYLLINKERVCTRDKILFSVWGYSAEVESRVVDVHVAKLRKKLENKNQQYIESVRGFGYRIVEN
jgi:two-component system response regulator ArlR